MISADMFSIEFATREHIPLIHAAIDIVAREGGMLGIAEAPPMVDFSRQLQAAMDCENPLFVANIAGGVVGWCMIFRNEAPPFKHVGYLFMGILPNWRRRGIGASLLQASLGSAWQSQFCRIELEVLSTNDPAIALYQGFGFTLEGIKRQAYLFDGKYSDVCVMGLLAQRCALGRARYAERSI